MQSFKKAKWLTEPRFVGRTPRERYFELGADKAPVTDANLHVRYRREFSVEEVGAAAKLLITADDVYRLYVNGEFVGMGPAPGYPFNYYYNEYDVSRHLHPGKNVIAVHTYYQGLVNRVFNSGDGRQGLIAELFVGGKSVLATDELWKYCQSREFSGAAIGYQTQFLENIDNREKPVGWTLVGFDDAAWDAAVPHKADHRLVAQPTANLRFGKALPAKVTLLADGEFYDFGKEYVGTVRLRVTGNRDEIIEVQCAEELDERGLPRFNMRCNCKYQEFWTLAGGGEEFEPFDYKGFRYVRLKHGPNVKIADIYIETRGYPYEEGAAVVGHPLLTPLFELSAHTMKVGIQEGFLDCPTREKGQYSGDLTVSGATFLYMNGDASMFLKALDQFAQSARVTPGMLNCAPGSFRQEIADYSLQYPHVIRRYYDYTGDIDAVARLYGTAAAMREEFRRYESDDGLLYAVTDKWNLVDWPMNLRDGYDVVVDGRDLYKGAHNVINAFYLGMLRDLNGLREILGLPQEATDAREQAFNALFFVAGRGVYRDRPDSEHSALHSNVLPLFFGFAPREARSMLAETIMEKGLVCGVYFSYFVLKALANAGRHDLCYQLMVNEGPHSWANMLREGATTALEAWGVEQKWNTSLCHPWGTAYVPVFIEELFGAIPQRAGYESIRLVDNLPFKGDISVSFRTPIGLITVKREGGKLSVSPDSAAKRVV